MLREKKGERQAGPVAASKNALITTTTLSLLYWVTGGGDASLLYIYRRGIQVPLFESVCTRGRRGPHFDFDLLEKGEEELH